MEMKDHFQREAAIHGRNAIIPQKEPMERKNSTNNSHRADRMNSVMPRDCDHEKSREEGEKRYWTAWQSEK
jgi:hypothetical protein